jgi:hypothetical protein
MYLLFLLLIGHVVLNFDEDIRSNFKFPQVLILLALKGWGVVI